MSAIAPPSVERVVDRGPSIEPDEKTFQIRDIDWQTYQTISKALEGRHLHLMYDRGLLELMTISQLHGRCSRLLVRFVMILGEELEMTVQCCGDMTLDRADLERGIEPDEGFYLINEPLVRAKTKIDLSVDPPPDLGVEVDISRSSHRR